MTIRLSTSNMDKIREYARFGLAIEPFDGPDQREPDADIVTVAVHKALGLLPGHAAEDTALWVDGEDVGVNVRWLMDRISCLAGKTAVWSVAVGLRTEDSVEVYRGDIRGTLVETRGNGFGFDPWFLPDGSSLTLAELDRAGQKDGFSARRLAAEALVSHAPAAVFPVAAIAPWTGPWQHG